jgi:hypothetical protein
MRKYRIMRVVAPCLLITCIAVLAAVRAPVQGQGQGAPKYKFDPESQRSDQYRTGGGAEPADSRLLCSPAGNDSLRQARERDRFL